MSRQYNTDGLTIDYFGPRTELPARYQDWWGVFIEWKNVLHRYSDATYTRDLGSDEGWTYGERPQVGFLAAAIWKAGGVAIEEYEAQKKGVDDLRFRYRGRADLWGTVGEYSYSLEAKHKEVRLDTSGTLNTFLGQMTWAGNDVKRVIEHCNCIGAVAFLPLKAPVQMAAEFDALRLAHIDDERFGRMGRPENGRLFVVHLFPTWRTNPYQWEGKAYLGVTVLLAFREAP